MESNGRMDRVEIDLARLTAGKHDEQIQKQDERADHIDELIRELAASTRALVARSGQNDAQKQARDEQIREIVEATKVLLGKPDFRDDHAQKQRERADRIDERLDKLSQSSQKNDEHIGIVVGMMDEWIRSRGGEKGIA